MSCKAFDIIPSFLRATSIHAGTKPSKHSPVRSIHCRFSTRDEKAQSLLPRTCKPRLRTTQSSHCHLDIRSKIKICQIRTRWVTQEALSFMKQRAAPANHSLSQGRNCHHLYPRQASSDISSPSKIACTRCILAHNLPCSRPTHESFGCPTVPHRTDHPIWVSQGPPFEPGIPTSCQSRFSALCLVESTCIHTHGRY